MAAATGRNVERIGHRGSPRRHLENTLPSFEEALRQRADAVELDVHVTRDGQVVVHHDAGLKKGISPRTLAGKPINALSGGEVASVDLGAGSRIPLLAPVLALVKGKATAYVEVKAGDIQSVVDVIRASGATCAVHSFDHDAIVTARRLAPDIPRGILFDEWPSAVRPAVERTAARDVWPRHSLLTRDRVREIHDLGCRVIVWTVNDAGRARELDDWGVDGICTDDLTLF